MNTWEIVVGVVLAALAIGILVNIRDTKRTSASRRCCERKHLPPPFDPTSCELKYLLQLVSS
jgi:hypothetical protein